MSITPEWAAVIVAGIAALGSLASTIIGLRTNLKFEQLKNWAHENFIPRSDVPNGLFQTFVTHSRLLELLNLLRPGAIDPHGGK